jgi:hypothetical protein
MIDGSLHKMYNAIHLHWPCYSSAKRFPYGDFEVSIVSYAKQNTQFLEENFVVCLYGGPNSKE